MKEIYNYKKATVADLESDGLLEEATKVHVLSYKLDGKSINSLSGRKEVDRIKGFFQYHLDNNIPVVFHNGIGFDIPLIEKIFGLDLSKLMVIDTLAVSWYLNHDREIHGLDSFFADYGIAKPVVEDGEWKCESEDEAVLAAHYQKMKHRCTEDVKINVALWDDLVERLEKMYAQVVPVVDAKEVGGQRVTEDEEIYLDRFIGDKVEDYVNRILTFLCFKMDCARLQEKTMWEVDVEYLQESEKELLEHTEKSAKELESVMPPVPKYASRKRPAKPFKKNGDLSASGLKWQEMSKAVAEGKKDDYGNPLFIQGVDEITELVELVPPNINSVQQVKDFLFSKGWVPQNFEYKRDKEAFENWIQSKPTEGSHRGSWKEWKDSKPKDREVPQISVAGEGGKELCPSIVKLAEVTPEIKALENYSMVKHRLGTVQGFLKNLKRGKYLQARVNGFTNTLRVRHAEVVNLPAANKPFAEAIRGCLIAGKGKISLGADMSGIEDRTKHHFMIPYDPEYVSKMMEDDYDPHLETAVASGTVTPLEAQGYKMKTLDKEMMLIIKGKRAVGKTTNYASVYGAGAAKLALTADISLKEAEAAVKGYWELNWAVKAIAEDMTVIKCDRGFSWLLNPLNGHLYSLRSVKDVFSTLAQGTGSYLFDMWVDQILTKQEEKWGRKSLTGSFHDEVIIVVKDKPEVVEAMEKVVRDSIDVVSEKFMLRRKLGCDCQFGYRYSEIH